MNHAWRKQKSAVRPTVKDLHWAAGFLEGDGCFKSSGTTPAVSAVQSFDSVDVLLRLLRLFGGSLYGRPLRENGISRKPQFTWTASGARARGIAMTLYSLMGLKRQMQIRFMLERGEKNLS